MHQYFTTGDNRFETALPIANMAEFQDSVDYLRDSDVDCIDAVSLRSAEDTEQDFIPTCIITNWSSPPWSCRSTSTDSN
jgi:hypothetical protein